MTTVQLMPRSMREQQSLIVPQSRRSHAWLDSAAWVQNVSLGRYVIEAPGIGSEAEFCYLSLSQDNLSSYLPPIKLRLSSRNSCSFWLYCRHYRGIKVNALAITRLLFTLLVSHGGSGVRGSAAGGSVDRFMWGNSLRFVLLLWLPVRGYGFRARGWC